MMSELFPTPATKLVMGNGTPMGVTDTVAACTLVPTAFTPRTEAVYVVLLVRPEMVHVRVLALVEQLCPPGDNVAVYPVSTEPLGLAGSVQVSVVAALATVAETVVGLHAGPAAEPLFNTRFGVCAVAANAGLLYVTTSHEEFSLSHAHISLGVVDEMVRPTNCIATTPAT